MPAILHLTLHRKWFDLIASGSKTEEYRIATPYWKTRLEGKTFDQIHFVNGYGSDKPSMRAICKRIEHVPQKGIFVIHLGKISQIKNYR